MTSRDEHKASADHGDSSGSKTLLTNNAGSRRIWFRVVRRLLLNLARATQYVLPQSFCMKLVVAILKSYGMQIRGQPIYISPTCWFDGTDYALITIEDRVVISSHVSVLTHDFSLDRAMEAITGTATGIAVALVRPVRIGRNSFIGRGTILMPGTDIGENCIVAAGSVVRGSVPDQSLVMGNPAQVVGNTLEWGMRKMESLGFTGKPGMHEAQISSEMRPSREPR